MVVVVGSLAVVFGGLLAGLSLDRSVVALPAWRRVGVAAWATFSRQADLGHGLVLYPLLGLGAPLLSVATAIVAWLDPGATAALAPAVAAVALSVGHVVATARAAPNMGKVRGADPAVLPNAFAAFARWQAVRATLQVLAFGANLWTLNAVLAA